MKVDGPGGNTEMNRGGEAPKEVPAGAPLAERDHAPAVEGLRQLAAGLPKADAIARIRVAPAKHDLMCHHHFPGPEGAARERFMEAAAPFDLTPSQINALWSPPPKDGTGAFDARGNDLVRQTVQQAQVHIDGHPEESAYLLATDFVNLAGLNKALHNVAASANRHLEAISSRPDAALNALAVDLAPMRASSTGRHIVTVGRADEKRMLRALRQAKTEAHLYALQHRLDQIKHPGRRRRGVDLNMALVRIEPGQPFEEIVERASDALGESMDEVLGGAVLAEPFVMPPTRWCPNPDESIEREFYATAAKVGVGRSKWRPLFKAAGWRVERDPAGVYSARSGHTKAKFVRAGQAVLEAAASQGRKLDGYFISWDLINLGGITKALGRADADRHMASMIHLAAQTVADAGYDICPMRTGGDEFGDRVIGENQTREQMDSVVQLARERVDAYGRKHGLDAIEHHRRPGEKGFGLHAGIAPILPGLRVGDTFELADLDLNRSKAEGQHGV
ncbi:hypothetical protein [Trinickia acidisoli]|uniref:hypothetical protein n=1 Tax=Trinickia acidisoli TaxID=2767482 RepID=UPI001A8D9964|nr:hypothetical protein [Trinickia acidisoli]